MMGKIIFLNGCGSSGKTSIAYSIQHLSKDLWLTFGTDTFISMMPYMKENNYLSFVPGNKEHENTMHVKTKPKGSDFFSVMLDFANLLADKGQNLIIDEVLFDDDALKNYTQSLSNHTVYYIGVFCDLARMQEREILRRDRHLGLSNDQIKRVHFSLRARYDFKVNTTNISPFEAAKQILTYIETTVSPQAFKNIGRN
jgi:chloramphenicol 3-O phosphotransferase